MERFRDSRLHLTSLALVFFPVIYWWPALAAGSFAHLGTKTNDFDGDFHFSWLIHQASLVSNAQNFTNMPFGESLWRWQTFTHALPVVAIWILGHVCGPILAVKIYAILGWIFSGWVVKRITERVGVSHEIALITGVLFQMLPWNRYVQENWIHYAWSGVPLLALMVALGHESADRWSLTFNMKAVGLLMLAGVVDGYWAYYTAFIFGSVLCVDVLRRTSSPNPHARRRPLYVLGLCSIAVGVWAWILLPRLLGRDSVSDLSRPLEITDRTFIDTYGGEILDLVRPDSRHAFFSRESRLTELGWSVNPIQYLGLISVVAAITGVIVGIRRARPSTLILVTIVSVMLSLSLRTSVSGLPTLAGLVREFTPALRWTWRASLIAQAGLLALTALFFEELRRRGWTRKVLLPLLCVILLDLNPLGGRQVVDQSIPWRPIREQLASDNADIILFLPSKLPTQSWMEQVFIEYKMVNGLFSQQSVDTLRSLDQQGPCQIYQWLLEHNVTHLVLLRNLSQVLPGYVDLINLNPAVLDGELFPLLVVSNIKVVGNWISPVEVRRIDRPAVEGLCLNY
jgi:hypothetical protein